VILRAELERFGGREVTAAGDGFFAVFTGPAWPGQVTSDTDPGGAGLGRCVGLAA
jgi:hypothetical protein